MQRDTQDGKNIWKITSNCTIFRFCFLLDGKFPGENSHFSMWQQLRSKNNIGKRTKESKQLWTKIQKNSN